MMTETRDGWCGECKTVHERWTLGGLVKAQAPYETQQELARLIGVWIESSKDGGKS